MKNKLLITALLLTGIAFAQESTPPIEDTTSTVENTVLDFADVESEFAEFRREMKIYVQSNLIYPEISRELGDQGKVYVAFIVEPDGSVSNIEVTKNVTPELDAEAFRLVKNMPQWSPPTYNGEPVRLRCTLPISFTLVQSGKDRKKRN